ncbi:hypothetical protein A2531_02750 [Candidatus Falkowbacteria bacterium RIFOXYD2_FULL_34_120]|uniref:Polymerase nucleotidyl transferase domain-containing protein n=1 Tax=Candidatus Falkowbacteria bacterium RIFOXYD2_FULL_34_120 TaxID=1798007 RepID=A0A1F5TRL8_9BACT|nr:MAG: hypothetical protein A2466_03035 [Candidatus Falkowbacteria bacterium RIFOXYC2_FULL_34_220]OGF39436.1 MAG: hypothetical protein A2515_03855 [Candidatus Falkowbacteria bacterium RIFOXYD12_FULL_34_57]OGF41582.1 MAG: hypothetical protein A2531_02750 [Candidatus Falkowbacteria bacterium RIFOXYD2_FULL_34_120]
MIEKFKNLQESFLKEEIGKAIMRVIVLFDIFNYPLTEFEVWQYLCGNGNSLSLNDVKKVLADRQFLEKYGIVTKQGFYYLSHFFSYHPEASMEPGAELKNPGSIVKTRMDRYNHTDRKFKIALKVARWFKLIPWIRMIAVGNIIGANNLDDNSDIDLFVITERNRAWITRLFCAGLMAVFNMRPKPEKKRDKICLSFFIDENNMNLEKIKISRKDIYFDYWLLGLKPIYDAGSVYAKFIEENSWIRKIFSNWIPHKSVYFRDAGKPFPRVYHDIIDLFFGGLSYKLKNWQIRMMPDILRQMMNRDKRVIVQDGILKLHVNDRREKIFNKYLKLIESL